MKLRLIVEASKKAIKDSSEALGDLIDFVKGMGPETKEYKDLFGFLSRPTAKSWEKTSWVVDSAIRQTQINPEQKDRAQLWAKLKSVTSPIVAVSVYDVDSDKMKETPLQNLRINAGLRKKFKRAVGPQGYVGALSNVDDVPITKLKKMMKNTAKDSAALVQATKKAGLPIKPVTDF